MIFATGSTYSQGTPAPDWMAPVMGVVIGLTIVGAALSGSYEQVRDAHAPATHFLALEDHFEEHCQRKEVWVPLSYGPFASGKNRYLLNYVRIQRPYGSLAAFPL